jgi:hypothetical protein
MSGNNPRFCQTAFGKKVQTGSLKFYDKYAHMQLQISLKRSYLGEYKGTSSGHPFQDDLSFVFRETTVFRESEVLSCFSPPFPFFVQGFFPLSILIYHWAVSAIMLI